MLRMAKSDPILLSISRVRNIDDEANFVENLQSLFHLTYWIHIGIGLSKFPIVVCYDISYVLIPFFY